MPVELSDVERLRQFEALVHASPEFIAIADVEGRVQFVNQAGRRLVGMPDDFDVTTATIADFLTEEGLQVSVAVEQPAVMRDGWWQGETTLRDWLGGPAIPVAVSSFLVTDLETGAPLALATLQRDLRETHAAVASVEAAEHALLEGEQRQRSLLLNMSDVLVVVADDGTLKYASPSASRLLGYAEGSLLGTDGMHLVHPDDRPAAVKALARVAVDPPSAEPGRLRVRLMSADGTYRHYEALANNLLAEPSVRGVVIVARDVTEQHRAELSQTLQARVLELIANGAPVPEVLDALSEWFEATVEGTYCSILLIEDTDDGRVLRHAASPSLPKEYHDAVDQLPVSTSFSPCAVAVTNSAPTLVADLLGDERWAPYHDLARRLGVVSCWSFPVQSPATGQTLGTFALYRDHAGLPDDSITALIERASHLVGITVDRAELVERLAHQATHDGLTGLPNRTMLLEKLTAALDRRPVSGGTGPVVVFLDLDRLKIVNDSLGHERGDELLARIAERLPLAVPDDVLVARFGGDEFVVLSERTPTREDAVQLVERVLDAISQPVRLEGRIITPTASAGVVVASAGQTATEVLRDADIAMYRAKHRGGSGYQFSDADMRQRAFDRLDLEGQIRHALSAGELRLHYQPVVDLERDGAIIGFEALVRWQHPTRGLLSPASFVELAEETGLVVPMGEWVLRTAAATARAWAQVLDVEGLTLAVNISAKQLASPGLVALVRECREQMRPWQLSLELTESTLMDEATVPSTVLDELRAVGVQLSIDDFGTGFSSLSYLTRLPVSTLKIDRSFVHDLDQKASAATVAAAVISLGRGLQLRVIAEGIETPAQRDALVALGCTLGQGYLYGRPVAEDDALALLKA
jgi:diguanylate cyclase (GGDEF)-like protein/PAS domain S-box-containing protein